MTTARSEADPTLETESSVAGAGGPTAAATRRATPLPRLTLSSARSSPAGASPAAAQATTDLVSPAAADAQASTALVSPAAAEAQPPTAAPALTGAAVADRAPPVKPTTGPRHRRRLSRRRRIVEQLVIVLIFAVALGVTVLFLASQWLLNASVTGTIR